MNRIWKFLSLLLLLAGTMACSRERLEAGTQAATVTYTVSDTCWTYLSLETGRVVGTALLGDEQAEAEWRQRTDWDIALCGDLLRTNSGTSGNGGGGCLVLDEAFENVLTTPEDGYLLDTETGEIW